MNDSSPQPPAQTIDQTAIHSAPVVPPSQEQPPVTIEEVEIADFAKINLRVATIEGVEAVPKSKKLYQLSLDLGDLGKRTIVSGIALHYTPEQLLGKQIVVIANLKPAKLMGVESRGMLLAASTNDDGTLALLTPDKPILSGSKVR